MVGGWKGPDGREFLWIRRGAPNLHWNEAGDDGGENGGGLFAAAICCEKMCRDRGKLKNKFLGNIRHFQKELKLMNQIVLNPESVTVKLEHRF